MAVGDYCLGQDGGELKGREGLVLGSPGLLGVFVMGSKGCLKGRQLPPGAHVAQQGAVCTSVYVPWLCQLEL